MTAWPAFPVLIARQCLPIVKNDEVTQSRLPRHELQNFVLLLQGNVNLTT